MPTRGRKLYAEKAVRCFLAQSYAAKQLYILDDLDDRSFTPEQAEAFPESIHYTVTQRMNIPEKRNWLCRHAQADLIAHFDSDDYSTPERMAEQVALLQESGKAMTGYYSILFVDEAKRKAGVYSGRKDYACGTSLMFTKDWWKSNRFIETKRVASDNPFVNHAEGNKQLVSVPGSHRIVARIHSDNTNKRSVEGYRARPWESVPEGFFTC